MALTATGVEAAKPKEKLYRLSDERGLCLEVPTRGAKRWRFRYRINTGSGTKAKMISLGTYPETSLAEARTKREDMRTLVSKGIDPSEHRKREKVVESGAEVFEAVAREWFQKFSQGWSDGHAQTVIDRLTKNIFPFIGQRSINELNAADMLTVIQRIEKRGALEVARRTRGICSQVFRYGVVTGRCDRDPAADIQGALPPVPKSKHHASIVDPKKIGPLLRAIDSFDGTLVVSSALRFAPLTFVRPGELRRAEWTEFDLERAEWRIPAAKMKKSQPHIVPLSTQAVEVLKSVQALTGSGKYVFPSVRTSSRPMSENTINAVLRRLGYSKEEMTGHGFRSMASTLLNEQGWNRDAIERQLAHAPRDKVRASYNFAEHMPERKRMMQAWADYLDGLKAGGKILPIKTAEGV